MEFTVTTRLCSALTKVFPDSAPEDRAYEQDAALKGEKFSFILAYRMDAEVFFGGAALTVELESPLKKHITVRKVDYVPVRATILASDNDVLRQTAGLYPDILTPLEMVKTNENKVNTSVHQWESLWITTMIPPDCPAGVYPITVKIHENAAPVTFKLEVLDAVLPPQKLIHTEWFHADCLAVYYNVPMWSEEHWRIVENFVANAVHHGINMLLTPVFTPPLDTAVGGERPTTQLVQVKVTDSGYEFDFSRLARWVEMAERQGVEYFEISHLYTQWGAEFTPKIMAEKAGVEQQIFGWQTKAVSPEYQAFLAAFLPELTGWLKKHNLQHRTYFHCSDEPNLTRHLATYQPAAEFLLPLVKGFKTCDALSDATFYQLGLISTPIPSCEAIEPFMALDIPERWTYYCCCEWRKTSNRFLNMPSARTRIMGTLLYRYDIAGFLQWGFNFYYSQFSLFPINPFAVLDANYGFPPGDAFMVYPGSGGVPLDSLRHEVFYAGLQDMRVLQWLETRIGREKLAAMLDKVSPQGRMSMTEYPRGEAAVLNLRKQLNELVKQNI